MTSFNIQYLIPAIRRPIIEWSSSIARAFSDEHTLRVHTKSRSCTGRRVANRWWPGPESIDLPVGGWPSHFTRQFCCSCPGVQETPRKATLKVFHTDWSGMKWIQYIWPCSFLCEDSPNFLQILREQWFSLGLSIYPYNMWFIPIIGITPIYSLDIPMCIGGASHDAWAALRAGTRRGRLEQRACPGSFWAVARAWVDR